MVASFRQQSPKIQGPFRQKSPRIQGSFAVATPESTWWPLSVNRAPKYRTLSIKIALEYWAHCAKKNFSSKTVGRMLASIVKEPCYSRTLAQNIGLFVQKELLKQRRRAHVSLFASIKHHNTGLFPSKEPQNIGLFVQKQLEKQCHRAHVMREILASSRCRSPKQILLRGSPFPFSNFASGVTVF